MPPPAFDPNSAYAVPSFDPTKDYQAAQAAPTPTPPEAAPEGFWHSLGATLGITPEAAQKTMEEFRAHPIQRTIEQLTGVTPIKAIAEGMAGQARQSFQSAKQAIIDSASGNNKLAAVDAVKAVPIVGPGLDKATDQYASGDIAGEAGTLLGTAAQAAPMATAAIETSPVGPALRSASNLPRQAVGRAALLGKTPEAAYESALKPSTSLSPADRAAMVKTGLENEIPVSKQGLEDIGTAIDNLNQAIKDQISSDPTRPIDPNKVVTRADQAKAKFAKQVNAQGDLNAIDASKQQFLDEQGAKPGKPATPPRPTGILDAQGNPIMDAGTPAKPPTAAPAMNAADAQEMKQGTYRVLRGKFGEQGSASVEAQKALARGLKEEIANQFPEISKLNADESRLLDLQPVLERAVNRISNHQSVGIGTPVAGAAAKAVTGSSPVGVVASVLKSVLDNPTMKSRLAIMVSKGGKIPYGQAAARVQAYSTALGLSAGATHQTSDDQTAAPQP